LWTPKCLNSQHFHRGWARKPHEHTLNSEIGKVREMLGRKAVTTAMVLGEQILLGVIVLEELDLRVDCNRNRLVPYQGTWDQPVFRV
jgi:hypothetical protein